MALELRKRERKTYTLTIPRAKGLNGVLVGGEIRVASCSRRMLAND